MLILDCKKEKDLVKAISIIKEGGILIFPTDTIYGIGCDPYNEQAVKNIFKVKKREQGKPLPILTHNIELAKKLINLGEKGNKLAESFWPGPLTIVGELIDYNLPKIVTSGKKSLAVRIPNNTCILKILKDCDFIVGTSANISNENACISAQQVLASDLKEYDALLISQDKILNNNLTASTIIDVTQNSIFTIREGRIKNKDIYQILNR
ncbi:MAG: threonylcarbamoyl-AMP synthase [Nitrososphaeraceae archaeon]|nr:threonylcarbamoyl-AMP synthase [Nitrososphaeraceae archaeon]